MYKTHFSRIKNILILDKKKGIKNDHFAKEQIKLGCNNKMKKLIMKGFGEE